ncbi:MAG: YCF48-related protein [Bacteroidetes bacterium]|nr:YCF48-related protein [Bacteroidota bacterium]
MKKIFILYLFVISLFLANISFSQATWQTINIGTIENLNCVSFPNSFVGYAVGNNAKIYRTANAGLNWTAITSPSAGNNNVAYFIDALTGFVSSQSGFYKTTDAGDNWTQITLPVTYAVTSVHFSSASVGWAGDFYGDILKTTDAGNTWSNLVNMPGYRSRVFFVNDLNGWGVDTYGYVTKTTNGGASFTSQRLQTDSLNEVKFISSTVGMIAADSGRVYKTINGGTNWNLINTGYTNNLNSIYYVSPSKAYTAANNGMIISTEDGGASWTNVTISPNDLYNITFPPATSAGWVVGEMGTIAKLVNQETMLCVGSGNSSIGYPFFSYYEDSRTDMLYTSAEIVAAGGTSGLITQVGFNFDSISLQALNGFTIKMQHTAMTTLTDLVSTGWTTVYTGTYYPPGPGVQFILLNTPFAYTRGSNLLIEICFNNNSWTTNSYVKGSAAAGMTVHNHVDLPTGNGCVDITTGNVMPTRPNICFVANLITKNGNQETGLPSEFRLHQNYPNPFNPVTKIEYEVPKASMVNLTVYDALGREVAVLVNESKQAGKYAVDFNGSGLTSGVYFCRLNTSGFTDVKRMILIK